MIIKTKQKIMLAHLVQMVVMAARRLAGRGPITEVSRQGVRWLLDLREGIDFSIWLFGSFEPETVRCYQQIIKPGDVVLDIGANIGAHTPHLARCVGLHGKVFAFEPTDYAFAKLTQNIALNPDLSSRIRCLQLLLSDTDAPAISTTSLYSSWPLKSEANTHHLHQGKLMTTQGARTLTLDSALASVQVSRLDCIKLDIDGAECAMLRGAQATLSRWHPTIVMELAPYVLEERGSTLAELIELLKAHGYILAEANTGKSLAMDTQRLQEVIPEGASLNVVARVP
jgi:FkbM family methyltransferase